MYCVALDKLGPEYNEGSTTIQDKIMNEYEQQAKDFLDQTGSKFEINLVKTETLPPWADKEENPFFVDKYEIVLIKGADCFRFDFYQSVADSTQRTCEGVKFNKNGTPLNGGRVTVYRQDCALKVKGKEPTAYDLLACLDCCYFETVEEFVDEYGYEINSVKDVR